MEQYRDKIEHFGVIMEKMGLTPVAARIFVYLLLCDDHQATFEDITSYLKVSKSAISNGMKLLLSVDMVDSKTMGGQRKRYFFVNPEKWITLDNNVKKVQLMCDLLQDIMETRQKNDDFRTKLEELQLFYKMVMVEYPIIFQRWKNTVEMNRKK